MENMKTTLITIFILFSFQSFGQIKDSDLKPLPLPDFVIESNEIIYREIIEIEGTKENLHSTGLKSISDLYRSSKSVIDLNDVESGTIVVKGNLPMTLESYYVFMGYKPTTTTYIVSHTLTIESKENRIRVTITNFKFESAIDMNGTLELNSKIDKQYIDKFKTLKNSNNLKKPEIATLHAMSLILNSLDITVDELMKDILKNYKNSKNDDWQ